MLKTSLIAGAQARQKDCMEASEPCARSKGSLVQSPAEFTTSRQDKKGQMPHNIIYQLWYTVVYHILSCLLSYTILPYFPLATASASSSARSRPRPAPEDCASSPVWVRDVLLVWV